jgi:hypothetical protein
MKHGKTAVYTILKNEKKYIEKWLYYANPFDYKVLLDTGSTDGSWELLQEYASKDPKLIIEQKTFDPWRFDTARNYNLNMVPEEVVWCLSPDLDEYYSINTHDEMEVIISAVPDITCIASDRLDIYSRVVRVGPPNLQATNKIHRRHDYIWKERIYEHISWKHGGYEKELYSDDIFLVHDQDFKKKERSELYIRLMEEEWAENPKNSWNNWFLLYHYFKSQQLEKYIPVACNYLLFHTKKQDKNYEDVTNTLKGILAREKISDQHKHLIVEALKVAR